VSDSRARRLGELVRVFGWLGATAFGGPAAHIALMEDACVRRRQWLTHDELVDLIGAANLIPGPNSTELAIHIGHRRAGWLGLVVAGAAFILPAALIVGALAWVYVRWGALPAVAGVMAGVKPVVVAIVIQAIWNLGKTAVKTAFLGAVGGAAAAAALLGVDELAVLGVAGAAVALSRVGAKQGVWLPLVGAPAAAAPAFSLAAMFLAFVKIGAVLFGSGYVLVAFLRGEFVDRWHWLTESQLLDAVAVGQVTPGPVFTTATFIGYVLGGGVGSVLATIGIFLPAFVFVAISGPLVPRIRRSQVAGAVLDGVNVASLGLMAAVTVQLGRAAVVDIPTAAIALAAAAILVRYRPNPTWLVAAGAALGVMTTAL
jgi:chromate transporter